MLKEMMLLTLLVLFIYAALGTITPGNKVKGKSKQLKLKNGPQNVSVYDLDLIEAEPSAKDILINCQAYFKDTSLRNFNNTVLGYVTPWNSQGYNVAKIFTKKFNIISPVWFQLIKQAGKYSIAGDQDIDSSWITEVRRRGDSIDVLPRFVFEKFNDRDFSLLLSQTTERAKVSEVIINICLQYGFEGIVLEYWSQLTGRVDNKFLINLAMDISKALKEYNLKFVLVIPPMRKELPNAFSEKELDELYSYVYAFSLMTYDYSSVHRPGANAPLYWIKQTIENLVPTNSRNFNEKRQKILLGINMYGNDYTPDGGGPIVAHQYLDLLRHVKKRLSYDEHDEENFFEIRTTSGRHYVFYPSLYSINKRIRLAQELKVGISIWELGQGLNYFYDLF
uniref:Chitinase domain-containing protein 1 n=1 Tax=Glossina brevipalpis TaxID=37001 RepID=A0A1A9X0P7_9MUSC